MNDTASTGEAAPREGPIARLGAYVRREVVDVVHLAGLVTTALGLAVLPGSWPRTTRSVFARQLLFTGVEAILFVTGVAALIGVSVVLQATAFLAEAGQTEFLGPLLTLVVVRELAPLIVNVIVIVRSGSAVATELGNMRVAGEVSLLDGQGLDPLRYLVLPRMVAIVVATCCLTVLFIVVSFATGYGFALLLRAHSLSFLPFLDSMLDAMTATDCANVVSKCIVPPLLTGAICCSAGLAAGPAMTEVPRAATRALTRAFGFVFLGSVAISLLSYFGV